MQSPISYLKLIDRKAKLTAALKLQQSYGLRASIRLTAELNWVKFQVSTHLAAVEAQRAGRSQFAYV